MSPASMMDTGKTQDWQQSAAALGASEELAGRGSPATSEIAHESEQATHYEQARRTQSRRLRFTDRQRGRDRVPVEVRALIGY